MLTASASFALATAILFSASANSAPNTSMLRKCRNMVQKTPVVFVDGRSSTESALKQLDTENIRSVEVVCVNVADTTLMTSGSTTPGLGAIIVWTKRGPFSQLQPALAEVHKAQQAHFARTGAYAHDRASLQLPALANEIMMSIDVTANGWSASAWVDRRFSPRCRVGDSSPNGKVECSDS